MRFEFMPLASGCLLLSHQLLCVSRRLPSTFCFIPTLYYWYWFSDPEHSSIIPGTPSRGELSHYSTSINAYHLLLSLIGVDDPSHGMVNGTFVQIFVCFGLISILIPDSDQKKSSLPAVDCYLPDNLVKTLVKQFFPHGAQTNIPGLPADQSFIKFLVQLDDLYFRGRSGEDSLNP